MRTAALVVALANARADRRPAGAPRASFHDALADVDSANELLAPFLDEPVDAEDLEPLRALHRAVGPVVEALIDGTPPPVDALNRLAAVEPVDYALEAGSAGSAGTLRVVMRPGRPSGPGKLLLELIGQLGELDPARLRRCARPECGLVFYDATRSATQRWHAESPCGLRERQRRHRARQRG